MLPRLVGVGLSLALFLPGQARAQFTNVAAAAGVDVNARKDGGATFGDLNGDGWLDLIVNTSTRSYIFISDGGDPPAFSDETDTLAPRLAARRLDRSVVIADLTNDGHPEIIRDNFSGFEIFINGGPPGYVFGDPALAVDDMIDPGTNVEGVAVIDYDGDGWLDVFMENTGPQLYENPRDGTVDISRLDPTTIGLPDGRAMGINGDYVAAADFDVDGAIDLAYRDDVLPTLFANDGDGTFSAITAPALSSDQKGGIILCDFDANGLFDLFYTGGSGGDRNRIHLQTTARVFNEAPTPAPAGDVISAACGDVDNDGDLDLYLAIHGTDVLYLNRLTETGTMTFEMADLGAAATLFSEAVIFADYDNDGDVDLYVNRTGNVTRDTTVDPPVTIRDPARNILYQNGRNDQNYLMVEVLTAAGACPTPSRRSDIGAVASLSGPMGWESGVRDINGGQGHGTQGPPRMHFGLPMGAGVEYMLTVRFVGDTYPDVSIAVTPSALGGYQLLTVDATDIDGDGILTTDEIAESGTDPDPDGDGLPAWNDTDADGDGIPDAVEAGDMDPCTPAVDADGSGAPDYLESALGPVDAGPDTGGDGGTTDGGRPDVGDAAGSSVQAHGTGCVRCDTGGDGDAAPTLGFLALLASVAGARRSRRG